MKSQEDIVTISSSNSSEDSDWEEYLRSGESRSGDGYRCKCRKGHKNKKQTMACIAREDNEFEVEIWKDHVTELGKAIKREEKVSNRTMASMIRIGAREMGVRRENPAEPTFEGAALRPEAQECHQGDLYLEARIQSRKEGPPRFTYIYTARTDIWHKYLTSPKDIISSILWKVAQNAERRAIGAKIDMMLTLARCFQELTHREEVARKGFALGKNLSKYDGGDRVGRLALQTMKKWEKERTRNIQTKLIKMATEPARPEPNTKCDGCQLIPDSRLRQMQLGTDKEDAAEDEDEEPESATEDAPEDPARNAAKRK